MPSFNKVILVGNFTRDPELKYTPKGTAVVQFSIAVNRTWHTETGEVKEEVTFIDVNAFGRTAENINQYMHKGSSIMVEGRLKLDSWEGKDGTKRSKLSVIAETVQFLGGGKRQEQQAPAPSSKVDPADLPPRQPAPSSQPAPAEDDVPF